ncbi:kinase phosphorylation protein-domain-containing protein [Trametes meyenii]|nr:kinase phosphorylation protein-domain-containing protein [Trametes meyenii]
MFEPTRGGTRGGQAEFKWSDVSQDKDRENYLGHSINAPTGRWQKNKDVHWYQREGKQTDAERAEEIRRIKEAESERRRRDDGPSDDERPHPGSHSRRRDHSRSPSPRRRDRERSRSPRRRDYDRVRHKDAERVRSRSRTPPVRRRVDDPSYDQEARNRERERDRQRWEDNVRRDQPGARWGRD